MTSLSRATIASFFGSYLPKLLPLVLCLGMSACAVVAVADAGITVVATVVKVGAGAVGMAADVAGAGVRAVTTGSAKK